jgi:hypothetical protein
MLATLVILSTLSIVHRGNFKYGSTVPQGIKIAGAVIPESQKSSLLTLPPELRNEIYRLALISSEKIDITKEYNEPALLSVSRKIRDEATPILYLRNQWHIDLPDWDCGLYKAFFTHVKFRGISDLSKMKVTWNNSGALDNKTGLLRFTKVLHENEGFLSINYESSRQRDAVTSAAVGACEVAKRMRKQPWNDIDSVLEVYFDEVAKEKDGWEWV